MIDNTTSSLKILFTGDVVISDNTDISFSPEFQQELDQSHINCCNYEGPLLSQYSKPSLDPDCKIFQSLSGLNLLKKAGFNLFTLANNHIMNYNIEALEYTMNTLKENNLASIGAGLSWDEVYCPYIISQNDIRIGIINAAERQFGTAEQYGGKGHAWIFSPRIEEIILNLRKKCDYIVLTCHAGLENLNVPLPEWRETYQKFIKLGVDVIIAHHPHVIQGWENYHRGRIYYSLGNFIWKCPVNSCTAPSFAVSITFSKDNIIYREIPIHFQNNVLHIKNSPRFNSYLADLCDILSSNQNEAYNHRVMSGCKQAYESDYQYLGYYLNNERPWNKLRGFIRNILFLLQGRIRTDERKLYFYLTSETLRFTIARVIPQKNGWWNV